VAKGKGRAKKRGCRGVLSGNTAKEAIAESSVSRKVFFHLPFGRETYVKGKKTRPAGRKRLRGTSSRGKKKVVEPGRKTSPPRRGGTDAEVGKEGS